ncbi:MAG: imidazole glycerol phosphate synthase subunit HisH, partial [Actinobacteria bacterium]|nr:imidazole glycerol phosphate synthase subunit HisH [Actinomycetota bacterium]
MPAIAVLDYGMGNLRSVARALAHVGGDPAVTCDPDVIAAAGALVIPGVGHFGACMRALAAGGLDGAVRDFAAGGRPVFGVCLGMQVLLESSEEDPADGLAILPGASRKLTAEVKVPHMGWNDVQWLRPHPYVDGIPSGTMFYFVHSYAPDVDGGMTVGATVHGGRFSSVIARGNVFATQFHPEKSG